MRLGAQEVEHGQDGKRHPAAQKDVDEVEDAKQTEEEEGNKLPGLTHEVERRAGNEEGASLKGGKKTPDISTEQAPRRSSDGWHRRTFFSGLPKDFLRDLAE